MSEPLIGLGRVARSAAETLLRACGGAQSAWRSAKQEVFAARSGFIENKISGKLFRAPKIGFACAESILDREGNGSWEQAGWHGASQACSRFMAAAEIQLLRDLSMEIAAGGAQAGRFFAREAAHLIHASIECSLTKEGQRAPAMMIAMEGLAEQNHCELQARAEFAIRNFLPAAFHAADDSAVEQEQAIAEIARVGRWLLNEQGLGRNVGFLARKKESNQQCPSRLEAMGEFYQAWEDMAIFDQALSSAIVRWGQENGEGGYELLTGKLRSRQESMEVALSCSTEAESVKKKRARAL